VIARRRVARAHEHSESRLGPSLRAVRSEGAQSRTRVLHFITHLDHGGATDNTLLSVEGLDRTRYEVHLAAGPGELEERARAVADRLILLPYFRRELVSLADARVAIALWTLAKGYDVIHTHGSKAGVLGRLAARARGVPAVVHTIHGFPVHDYMPWLERRVLLAIERLAARCAHRILAVCDANRAVALELGIASADQLRVVVSGVSEGSVLAGSGARARAALQLPQDAPVVGTITRLMEQKAPLDFVAAAHQVVGKIADVHVLIVGDGPMHSEVKAAVAEEPRIHFLGFRDDVPDLLAAMDVVAFSSLWEGLGRALTEAVLAGKPIVTTATSGVPELVIEGVTGYITAPGNPSELAARIGDVLGLPDRGAAMGALGAQRMRGRYDVSQMIAGLDSVYQELLKHAPSQ
jgi:glycosyltransferase involved in cell wall biosynthesis